jgi:hypothetical protein
MKYLFMRKNIDNFFDDAETVKSFRFRSLWLKKPSALKYITLQNPFKI